jgi:Mn2+/Fe2+ NRAMP family transporter
MSRREKLEGTETLLPHAVLLARLLQRPCAEMLIVSNMPLLQNVKSGTGRGARWAASAKGAWISLFFRIAKYLMLL